MAVSSFFPVPAPTPVEAEALAIVASYLTRAGTTTATALLGQPAAYQETLLLATLRDHLLAGAALCDGVLDLLPRPKGECRERR